MKISSFEKKKVKLLFDYKRVKLKTETFLMPGGVPEMVILPDGTKVFNEIESPALTLILPLININGGRKPTAGITHALAEPLYNKEPERSTPTFQTGGSPISGTTSSKLAYILTIPDLAHVKTPFNTVKPCIVIGKKGTVAPFPRVTSPSFGALFPTAA